MPSREEIPIKNPDDKSSELPGVETEDTVPGLLYDLLQKEVIALRKAGHEKDQSLKDKDDAIEVDIFFLFLFYYFFINYSDLNIAFRC